MMRLPSRVAARPERANPSDVAESVYSQWDDRDQPPILNMTVGKGTGDAVKCIIVTLGPLDGTVRGPGAVAGRSSLDLDA